MGKMFVTKKNVIQSSPLGWDLRMFFKNLKDEIVITIPEWLQRKLQQSKWFANEKKKSIAYIGSAFKGTLPFTNFIVVDLGLLKKQLEIRLRTTTCIEQKDEIQKFLDFLSRYPSARWALIDGQSRGYLSIIPFFENEIPMQENIIYELKSKDENNNVVIHDTFETQGYYFKEMPEWVQENMWREKPSVREITDGSFIEIVDALISLQESISWESFQKIYSKYSFLPMFSRVKTVTQDAYVKSFLTKKVSFHERFDDEVNGHEFFISEISLFLKNKSVPDLKKISRAAEGKDDPPTKAMFDKIKKYIREFAEWWVNNNNGNKKISWQILATYIYLRDVLENGDNDDRYYLDIGLAESYNLITVGGFAKHLLKWDTTLRAKPKKIKATHPHWIRVKSPKTGKFRIVAKDDGYPASFGRVDDGLLKNRIIWLLKEFKQDRQDLIDKSVINRKTDMADLHTTIVDNNFTDTDGDEVDYRQFYHRGHDDANAVTKNNERENIKVQKTKSNQNQGKKKLIT